MAALRGTRLLTSSTLLTPCRWRRSGESRGAQEPDPLYGDTEQGQELPVDDAVDEQEQEHEVAVL